MTPFAFVALALGCAMVVKAAVDLRVPLGGLRRWLARADHVVTVGEDENLGPWAVRRAGVLGEERFDRLSDAAATLPTGDRIRACCFELLSCPYCTAAWVTAVATVAWTVHAGSGWSGLAWWLPLWAAAAVIETMAMP